MNFIRLDVPEKASPTVHRPVDELATRHGYDSVEAFAESIEPNEKVIDVGASISRLGHAVTSLRDDIEWVNLDIIYKPIGMDTETTKRFGKLVADAPKNLKYVDGSILNPPVETGLNQFTRVLSYWMLPHIIEYSPRHGVAAAWNLIQLGKPGGILSVGPRRGHSDNAETFTIPESDKEAQELALKIVKPWLPKS